MKTNHTIRILSVIGMVCLFLPSRSLAATRDHVPEESEVEANDPIELENLEIEEEESGVEIERGDELEIEVESSCGEDHIVVPLYHRCTATNRRRQLFNAISKSRRMAQLRAVEKCERNSHLPCKLLGCRVIR